MNSRVMKGWLISALLCLSLPSQAEDIDLFVGVPPGSADDLPNVLFVVDNTANWNTSFANLKAALSNTFLGLPENKFRVGIMLFNETGNPNSNITGGYVRAAIRAMDSTTKPLYSNLITGLDEGADKGNGAIGSLVMAEAWYYYMGQNAYAGTEKEKADYTSNALADPNKSPGLYAPSRAVWALEDNALNNFKANPKYNSPLVDGSCARNFIIYLSNGPSTDNNSVKSEANSRLAAAGGNTTTIPLSTAGLQDNPIDEWARFMKDSVLGINTYTIDINPVTNGQGPAWTAILQSMANVGGGKYFAVSSANGGGEIANALNTILSEIQSVDSVYASVSLPATVNTQGTYLNQMFIGMFRPAQNALPRWEGNLKQYRIGYPPGSTELRTIDADGFGAINSSTGFITECARSYWTPTTADTYWSNITEQTCLSSNATGASNTPDGNMVEKGGQGYRLRATAPSQRKVYYQNGEELALLTSSSLSASQVGATTDSERDLLVNWARGYNNRADDAQDNFIPSSAMRPSAHGDVVHSRPVAINFGTDATPDVTVFYGTNDGMLRAVDGDRSDGQERWAFLPQEFYPHIKRLRDNTQQIYYPGLEIEEEGNRKNYGFDGPLSAYQALAAPEDTRLSTAWIFATMRRGGHAIYAFNVINPAEPILKWRRGCLKDPATGVIGSCDSGLEEIGQSWSTPTVVKAAGYDGGSSPLILFGGGYDTCEDDFPHSCEAESRGSKVYALDADTGSVVASFSTERSVVADVKAVRNSNGMLMYGYTADLGGNIYRLSGPDGAEIQDTAPANWVLTRIASLGCDTALETCSNENRKFHYAPDVVLTDGIYYLMVGSGDREKPLGDASSVNNYFFMLQDRPTDGNWLNGASNGCDANLLCIGALLPISRDEKHPDPSALASKKGWYLPMNTGEQVVTSAITVYGNITFSTNEPTPPEPGECSNNLGTARVYNINYEDASATNDTRSAELPGGGFPPSPVVVSVLLDDGTTEDVIIGADEKSSEESGGIKGKGTAAPKARIYWNLEE